MRAVSIRKSEPMGLEELKNFVPSVFPAERYKATSERYSFLPSSKIVERFLVSGYGCYSAQQAGTRMGSDKLNHVKHSLRFRPLDYDASRAKVGHVIPELILTNDSMGSTSLRLELGLYRLVCSNGLTVSQATIGAYRLRHVSCTIETVLANADVLVGQFPLAIDTVERMQHKILTLSEQTRLAEFALGLRFPDISNRPFESSRMLQVRRTEDNDASLFSVYNVVQENVLRGIPGMRGIRSIDTEQKINHALWSEAVTFLD